MTQNAPADLAARLAAILPPAAIRDISPGYLSEPRDKWHGQAAAVVAPSNTEEVAAVIRLAGELNVGVIPYGGGTGLVGGQLTPEGPAPIVLSLERMKAIRGVYPEEGVLVAEAGATVAEVQKAADEAGLLFPLTYGADGTARIGGALAVNSGGINVLRYGMARDLCLGVEAVLPSGEVLKGLKRLRKDNTGYDLRNLLIGSEGTLGVITAAALRLSSKPAKVGTAFFAIPSPEAALTLLARCREHALDRVSAFEIISGTGLGFLDETGLNWRRPLAEIPEWSVLIELGTSAAEDPDTMLEEIFAAALEDELAYDGVIAQSGQQRDELWHMREIISEGNRLIGALASHDISLPISELPGFLERMEKTIADIAPVRINAFGHVGDGNLHYNAFPPTGEKKADWVKHAPAITTAIYDELARIDGSISAEHGVGRLKAAELEKYGDPVRLAAMRAIKAALDPAGIMNPGAVLRR